MERHTQPAAAAATNSTTAVVISVYVRIVFPVLTLLLD